MPWMGAVSNAGISQGEVCRGRLRSGSKSSRGARMIVSERLAGRCPPQNQFAQPRNLFQWLQGSDFWGNDFQAVRLALRIEVGR